MMPSDQRRSRLKGMDAFLERNLAGPLVLGLVLGGIPAGFMFGLLGEAVNSAWSAYCMFMFAPISVAAAVMSASTSSNRTWKNLFFRAFLTSLAAWLPVPLIAIEILQRRWGFSSGIREEGAALYALLIMAIFSAVIGWFIAVVYVFLIHRRGKKAPSSP